MAEIISLVKGDTVADLQVTLVRDDTGTAFNATGITLTMQIKKKGIDGIVAAGFLDLFRLVCRMNNVCWFVGIGVGFSHKITVFTLF